MAGIPSEHARDVREALRSVAADPDLGPATLSDAAAMSNLLKDLLPDAPREKNLLVAAAEAGLPAMMLEHVGQGIDARSAIRLAAASFGANTHFTSEACDWVATELAVALDLEDGLATTRSQLPPGDITTARAQVTVKEAAPKPRTATHAEPAEVSGPGAVPSATAHLVAARAEVAGAVTSPQASPARGRPGIGVLVALAGIVALLISFVIPLYTNPYDTANPVRVWGGPLAWWITSGPTASMAVALVAAILVVVGRAGRIWAAAASAALFACGVQLLFVFQSVWQQASANGDQVGGGLPLGLAGAALLIAGAVLGLVRAASAGQRRGAA
jgi:hypothetical protein